MKPRNFLLAAFALLIIVGGNVISARAQAAPSFKITAIKLVPFDQLTGEFEAEITPDDERPFFNEVSLGLFITVVITGKTDTFSAQRKVEITVTEGGKLKTKKTSEAAMVGANGKYHVPLFIDSGLCREIVVTAKLVGQKTASTMTRKVSFACGE